MENTPEPLRFRTVQEAAELLQVSSRTLQRIIYRKDLPAFKVGAQWRINRTALTKWLENLNEL